MRMMYTTISGGDDSIYVTIIDRYGIFANRDMVDHILHPYTSAKPGWSIIHIWRSIGDANTVRDIRYGIYHI